MRHFFLVAGGLIVVLAALRFMRPSAAFSRVLAAESQQATSPLDALPRYDSSGALLRPRDFETWVFVGASTGLSYEPGMSSRGSGEFKNVYITPEAYKAYLATGKFPEKTMLALALYDPSDKVSPAKTGYFEGEFKSLAFAVKDRNHSGDVWSYYDFSMDGVHLADSARAFPKSQCYNCHHQHALDDNVFVQFYPVLRKAFDARKTSAGHGK